MKKWIAVPVVFGLAALSLAGCSSAGPGTSAGCNTPAAGAVSKSVKVTGSFGKTPTKVKVGKTTSPNKVQRSVVTAGKGAEVKNDGTVNAVISMYDSKGVLLGSTQGQTTSFAKDTANVPSGIWNSVACTNVGSRVVVTGQMQTFLTQAQRSGSTVSPTASLIWVLDLKSYTAPAKPVKSVAPSALPKVTWNSDGVPSVATPKGSAPKQTEVAVLKSAKSGAAKVKATDSVTVNYHGVQWSSGKVFDSSWTKGTPATFALDQVVSGFKLGLVGQKVGSTVIIVMPQDQAYGSNPPSSDAKGALIFVVEIQKAAAASSSSAQ